MDDDDAAVDLSNVCRVADATAAATSLPPVSADVLAAFHALAPLDDDACGWNAAREDRRVMNDGAAAPVALASESTAGAGILFGGFPSPKAQQTAGAAADSTAARVDDRVHGAIDGRADGSTNAGSGRKLDRPDAGVQGGGAHAPLHAGVAAPRSRAWSPAPATYPASGARQQPALPPPPAWLREAVAADAAAHVPQWASEARAHVTRSQMLVAQNLERQAQKVEHSRQLLALVTRQQLEARAVVGVRSAVLTPWPAAGEESDTEDRVLPLSAGAAAGGDGSE